MSVKFCPLASGSNGNSLYIGAGDTHLLIDAGLSGKRIEGELNSAAALDGKKLDALFITHEHSDHIQGAGVLSRRFDLPVYATEKTWLEMDCILGKISPKNRKIVCPGQPVRIKDVMVDPFDIPHDAAQPVGYNIYAGEVKISVATDLGHITEQVKERLRGANILLLESNHDLEMLKNGPYPYYLKQRILGKRGHLSNVTAGELLCQIIDSRMKYVFLGHLSEENNRPLIAMDTVSSILRANKGETGTRLLMAQRGGRSETLAV